MTEQQKGMVSYYHCQISGSREKTAQVVYSFCDFCGYSIPDPFNYPIEAYEQTYQALAGGMSAIIDRLFPAPKKKTAKKSAGEKTKAAKTSIKKETDKAVQGEGKSTQDTKMPSTNQTKKKTSSASKKGIKKENNPL